ncbi:MAG TPA: ORF6N domain-containing protein [Sediminibacterium sp.]|jgi:hypothetical protein
MALNIMKIIRFIQNRIYEIRGERIILDRDLAALYETETKSINLAGVEHGTCHMLLLNRE